MERSASMPLPSHIEYVGEVIEASTTQFAAQCRRDRLHEPPAFGSFVKIAPSSAPAPEEYDPFADVKLPEGALFGIVYHATTASIEPNRRAMAFDLDEEQLHREQPQLLELLVTQFTALMIGHVEAGRMRTYLPPRPPRLHARVQECSNAEICAITQRMDFLRAILSFSGEVATDELIAAGLRHAYHSRGDDLEFLVRAGKEIALLLRDDYERLSAILRKLPLEELHK